MSAPSAVKRLAEQVALISSEYRRLQRRCADLEQKVEELSRNGAIQQPASNSIFIDGDSMDSGSEAVREQVKEKLEEMLADLADV